MFSVSRLLPIFLSLLSLFLKALCAHPPRCCQMIPLLSFFLFLPLDLFSRRPAAGIPLVRAVCSGWAQCHVKHLGKPHILCVATIWRYSRETDASSERERQAGVCYTDTTHTYTRDDVTVQSRSHLSILSLRFTWRLSLSLSLGHNKT